MTRRKFILMAAGFVATSSLPAAASDVEADVAHRLAREGFRVTGRRRTWLGRVRIEAESGRLLREIVFDPSSGEILRDYTEDTFAGGAQVASNNDGNGSSAASGTGSGDGSGAGTGSGDGSGAGTGSGDGSGAGTGSGDGSGAGTGSEPGDGETGGAATEEPAKENESETTGGPGKNVGGPGRNVGGPGKKSSGSEETVGADG